MTRRTRVQDISPAKLRPYYVLISLSLQRRYSPGWASASFKSFFHPSRFRATVFLFLHPSLATSSSTPSSQRSLGLPLERFPPGSLSRTLLDKPSSSWRMICPAHLSLLSLQNFAMSYSHLLYDKTVLGHPDTDTGFLILKFREEYMTSTLL